MTATRLLRDQVVAEQKMFWRNPLAAGFTFLFPILLLVIFAVLGNGLQLGPQFGGVRFTDYYVPGIVAFAIIAACFTNLAINAARQRDDGLLKRKRGTPLPVAVLLTGLVGSSLVVSAVMALLVTGIGIVGYDNAAPRHGLWAVLVVALGAVTWCALALAVTTAIPNADAAPAVLNIALLPLLFLSGVFFPVNSDTLVTIADLLPARPFHQALLASFDAGGTAGAPAGRDLVVLALWGFAGAVVAVRWFRWEPRR